MPIVADKAAAARWAAPRSETLFVAVAVDCSARTAAAQRRRLLAGGVWGRWQPPRSGGAAIIPTIFHALSMSTHFVRGNYVFRIAV